MNKFDLELNKKRIIILLSMLGVIILLILLEHFLSNRYERLKIDKDKYFIYTNTKNTENNSLVPKVNLNSSDASIVNNEITSESLEYVTSDNKKKNVTYRYNRSGSLISLVMIYRDIIDNKVNYNYKTYVFDLNKDGKLLSNDEILNKFNITYAEINDVMRTKMKNKYNSEVTRKIISKDCDFTTCFLNLRNIYNFIDDINIYVENNRLVVYRTYNVYTDYHEEKYYSRKDFKFVIK